MSKIKRLLDDIMELEKDTNQLEEEVNKLYSLAQSGNLSDSGYDRLLQISMRLKKLKVKSKQYQDIIDGN